LLRRQTAIATIGLTQPAAAAKTARNEMAHTVWRVGYEVEARLLERVGAFDLALTAALTGSAALLAWGAWSFANPTLRTVARIAVLYLSNARG
jgi:hypothetical protein